MSIGNLQESFFQAALQARTHITVHLLNGVKLSGKVRSFDKPSVVLETGTLEQLIFKHSLGGLCVQESTLPGMLSSAIERRARRRELVFPPVFGISVLLFRPICTNLGATLPSS